MQRRDHFLVFHYSAMPCPRCGAKVRRIRYAANETDYCAPCQTGGRRLADRALSRLPHEDWPRTLEEFEEYKERRRMAVIDGMSIVISKAA